MNANTTTNVRRGEEELFNDKELIQGTLFFSPLTKNARIAVHPYQPPILGPQHIVDAELTKEDIIVDAEEHQVLKYSLILVIKKTKKEGVLLGT